MKILAVLLFISMTFGQIAGIPMNRGVTIYPFDLIIACMALYGVVNGQLFVKKNPPFLLFPMKLCLSAILLSLAVNIGRYPVMEGLVGCGYAVRFALYVSLYLIVLKNRTVNWMFGLYGYGLAFACLGFIQYLFYPNLRNIMYLGWDPHYWRLTSTLLDPNFAGIIIVLSLWLGIYLLGKAKNSSIIISSELILFLAMLLTLSRSTYIAFIGSFFVYILWKRSWILLVGMGFCIGLFFLPFPNHSVTPILRQETSVARITNWKHSLSLIEQSPIVGNGFNLLRSLQEPEYSESGTRLSHAGAGVDNSFLFTLATTGLIGAIAFLFLISQWIWLGARGMEKEKGISLGLVLVLSLTAVSIHSLFVNSFFHPQVLIWLWILTGITESHLTSDGCLPAEARRKRDS